MSYTKKAFFGLLWIGLGAFIANLFGYLLRLFIARKFTVEEYGLIYAVMALFGLVAIFQSLGLGEALIKYIAAARVKKRWSVIKEYIVVAARTVYLSSFVVAVIAFLLAGWLAVVYFQNPTAALMVRVFSVAWLLSPFSILMGSIMLGFHRMDLRSLMDGLQSIILLAATVGLILAGMGIEAAMYAYVILYVFQYVIFIPVFLKKVMPQFLKAKAQYRTATLKKLMLFGIPVMLTMVAGMVLTYTDTVLLTLFSDLGQVGIYQAAQPTAKILLIIPGMLTSVMLPIIAELWERRKKKLIIDSLYELYTFAGVGALPLVIAIVAFPGIILNLLFGSEYLAGAPILVALALASLFMIMNSLNTAVASGMGFPKYNTISAGIGAGFNFVVNLVLIPMYGGFGAAISTLIAAIIMLSTNIFLLRRHLAIRVPVWKWIKTLACGAVFGLLLHLLRDVAANQYLKVVVALLIAAIVYAACIIATRTVTVKELLQIKDRVMKKG